MRSELPPFDDRAAAVEVTHSVSLSLISILSLNVIDLEDLPSHSRIMRRLRGSLVKRLSRLLV